MPKTCNSSCFIYLSIYVMYFCFVTVMVCHQLAAQELQDVYI